MVSVEGDNDDLYEAVEDEISLDCRLIQTVPAKEPQFDAVPRKSAMKKSAALGAKAMADPKHQSEGVISSLRYKNSVVNIVTTWVS